MGYKWKTFKQKLLPRSLFGRSLLIIVIPILLMQMIVGYVFFQRHWESTGRRLVFAVAGEIQMITKQIEQSSSKESLDFLFKNAKEALTLDISIKEQNGFSREPKPGVSWLWRQGENKLRTFLDTRLNKPFIIRSYQKERLFEVLVQLDKSRVISYRFYDRRLTSPATYIFLLWLIGSSIILMAIAILFMRNQIRPIRRLGIAAEKLGKGQDVANFKPEGAREVRQAARAFLEMRDRIQRQLEQRTAMLAGVSHDLRTPLTRMRLQLAMMKESQANEHLRQDLDEMEKMLDGYLTFARGEGAEETEKVDLQAMLERIVSKAKRHGSQIESDYTGKTIIRVRPQAMERALSNLVGNASKYADHVWVRLNGTEEGIEICVEDDGPGIPESSRDDVFKPFFRMEKSRNPKSGGIGLGLSIVKDVVNSHGGEIFLENSIHGGLCAKVSLPF